MFDGFYSLNEAEVNREKPNIIIDLSNQAKVSALLITQCVTFPLKLKDYTLPAPLIMCCFENNIVTV